MNSNYKKIALPKIIEASKLYKETYLEFDYLIYSKDLIYNNYYIIEANKDNFLHLTGVTSNLSAKEFFEKAYNQTLSTYDFDILPKDIDKLLIEKNNAKDDKSKGVVEKKIKNGLKNARNTVRDKLDVSVEAFRFSDELFLEEKFAKNRVSCSIATSRGNYILGFKGIKNDKNIPITLLKDNLQKASKNTPIKISLLASRKRGENLFDNIIIGDEKQLNEILSEYFEN